MLKRFQVGRTPLEETSPVHQCYGLWFFLGIRAAFGSVSQIHTGLRAAASERDRYLSLILYSPTRTSSSPGSRIRRNAGSRAGTARQLSTTWKSGRRAAAPGGLAPPGSGSEGRPRAILRRPWVPVPPGTRSRNTPSLHRRPGSPIRRRLTLLPAPASLHPARWPGRGRRMGARPAPRPRIVVFVGGGQWRERVLPVGEGLGATWPIRPSVRRGFVGLGRLDLSA